MAFTPLSGGGGGGASGGGFPSTDNFIFVDAAADPGGDGSAQKPFNTILAGSLANVAAGGTKIVWVMRGSYDERDFIKTGTYLGWDVTVAYSGAGDMIVDSGGSFSAKFFGSWEFFAAGTGHCLNISDSDTTIWFEKANLVSTLGLGMNVSAGNVTVVSGAVGSQGMTAIAMDGVTSFVNIGRDVIVTCAPGSMTVAIQSGGTINVAGRLVANGAECINVDTGGTIRLLSTAQLFNAVADLNSITAGVLLNVISEGAVATHEVDGSTTILGVLNVDPAFVNF